MAQFFIDRPVFAWVIAIGIMLGGALGISLLSVSQYPEVAPATVRISASYPGASAETVENSVTKVIEQNMTGLDNLDYMSASSSSDGSASISLTFNNAADADIAQVQVQNKLQLVESQLPDAVRAQGVRVTKSSDSILMVAALVSRDGGLSSNDLADLIASNIEDSIRRVEGVGDLRSFGSGYAMRVWLDADRLAKFRLTPADVTAAISAQNAQVSAGKLGATPQVPGTQLNVTITAQSQLQTTEQFRAIILKTETDGSLVRVGDVARVEIGAEDYDSKSEFNGRPSAGFAINLASGANALDTSARVRAALARLSATLPSSVDIVYAYDTTPFVRLSIEKVVHTLFEAIVLVFLVMYLFMQNLRATLIPVIAVPVVLLGTFGVLAVAGYSINTLTMFAMVLAIGLLVDDAIVVVENVERIMSEEGLSPREATRKSMGEITGALWGIALVLSAVFVPMAFFGGAVGVIYRQFSVAIVSAMLLSVLVAMVLTPALCATLLRPAHGRRRGFFGAFNRGVERTTRGYTGGVDGILKRPLRTLAVFLLIIAGAAALFRALPSSFLPTEDQGVLMTMVQLPAGATEARTRAVVHQVMEYYQNQERDAVDGAFAAYGFSFSGSGQNAAMVFVHLKDFAERRDERLSAQAVVGRAAAAFAAIRDAQVFALLPPTIRGMGASGGFDMYLQDAGGAGRAALLAARDGVIAQAAQNPALSAVRENGQPDQPQFHIDIDQEKATALGVTLSDINSILNTAWAGSYVNDFVDRGKLKPVYVQADAPFRMLPDDIGRWYARNGDGEMVPFTAFTRTQWTFGPPKLDRFNGVSAINLQGSAAAGTSSGEAMTSMERLVSGLEGGFTSAWSGLSYQERLAGNQALALYIVSALVVFLSLAALYESWVVPFAVMLSVPIGILGAVAAAALFGQSNDVYFKVGLLTTIGLAAKNAILIVEFAQELERNGRPLLEATLEAARLRLRPIVMTSFAFIMGVMPLVIATGAGSAAQNAIGIGVMGGMIASTLVGIFFVPLFYVLIRNRGQTTVSRDGILPTNE
ncbi:MAG: efflux RND transporter permease subunit [Gammaproteobacteria bacterium]|nr:efflux RND transporter permease subunit [Gammaproteobacteria bacterium]